LNPALHELLGFDAPVQTVRTATHDEIELEKWHRQLAEGGSTLRSGQNA
jgi:hypothetical protein